MKSLSKRALCLCIILLASTLPHIILHASAQHEARVAVILPFKANNEASRKSLDFYRGFLLAADHLKRNGISAHITAHDEGSATTPLEPTLTAAAPHADALVGFYHQGHVNDAATFGLAHEMPVLLPFCTRISSQVGGNPFVALPFPDDEAWAEETATLLTATLGRAQVLVIQSESTPISHRTQLTIDRLKRKGAKLKALPIGATPYDIADAMSKKMANLVVCAALDNDIVQSLTQKVRSVSQVKAKSRLAMLVQPEWYNGPHRQDGTWMGMEIFVPTIEFTAPQSKDVASLTESYRYWFHTSPNGTPPADFLTGYDMGISILSGLAHHGRNFLEKGQKTKGKFLDIAMKKSSEKACYTNHALRLLQAKSDGTMSIISF